MTWTTFNDGNSINSLGSENGVIIKDEELPGLARITIEKGGSIAPFSITLGIYGFLFHTNFYSTIEKAEEDFKWYKLTIEEIIALDNMREEERTEASSKKMNQLLDDLVKR